MRSGKFLPWLLGAIVTILAFAVWVPGLATNGLTRYSFFPLFGLLAFSIMWTHYVYGAVVVRFGWSRNNLYKRVSELVVLFCLWLHPGLLIYQLWIDQHLLPPASIENYLGSNAIFAASALAAWLAFLSYDILVKFKNRPFWQRHWIWVSISQALAMIIIYGHALKLGRHLKVGWFEAYWALLGIILLPCMVYLLWKEVSEQNWLRKMVENMKNKKLWIGIGLIAAALIVIGMYRMSAPATTKQPSSQNASDSSLTLAQVQVNDGQSGAKCWVIVDTSVYQISGFAQWVDGVHTPSGGKARCGKDLSDVMSDSPHGRSVLKLLTVVGTYSK